MSISDAEKSFKEAQKYLRPSEDRALWNMNAGFLHLCNTLKEVQAQMAAIDHKIVRVSHQTR